MMTSIRYQPRSSWPGASDSAAPPAPTRQVADTGRSAPSTRLIGGLIPSKLKRLLGGEYLVAEIHLCLVAPVYIRR